MAFKILTWIGLISVIAVSLFGFHFYFSFLVFLVSCLTGILTVIYFSFDERKIYKTDDVSILDNPLDETCYSIQLPRVLKLYKDEKEIHKFDQRITGSETVDSFLNEIINIIISDYVSPWYDILTNDIEFKKYSVKQTVISVCSNFSNRIKSVDWVQLLSTRFPEELITHLKLFKQSRIRLKHLSFSLNKDIPGSSPNRLSPKRGDDAKGHKRNKSDTDVGWFAEPQAQLFGKSKFYGSSDSLDGKTISEIFFNLECFMEERQICRDVYCIDAEKEKLLLCEVSEALLFLVAPEESWRCHPLKMIIIDLLSSVVLKPVVEMISDPDNINRLIIRSCLREGGLPTELFLTVIRCCEDPEELDATLDLVQKEIQKLHSRDTVGECELSVRQQLSSLQYLTRVIKTRRASFGNQEGLFTRSVSGAKLFENENVKKMEEAIKPSLQFLSASASWRSDASYLTEIELAEPESSHNSKELLRKLRSSALELCDNYLAPNKPAVIGVPEETYQDLVATLSSDNEEFDSNPSACFDELRKCIYEALEEFLQKGETDSEDPDTLTTETSAPDLFGNLRESSPKLDTRRTNSAKCVRIMKKCLTKIPKIFNLKRSNYNKLSDVSKSSTFPRSSGKKDILKLHTLPKCNIGSPKSEVRSTSSSVSARHGRSYSDVGNTNQFGQQINKGALLSAVIIETALVQEKGKTFGIYAISVRRLSDGEEWHIYRRYSDFYDLHCSIKDMWPELSHLPFPGKKTFQNTSRALLEKRKNMLNNYLQNVSTLAKERRYQAMMDENLLGGFLNPQNQSDRHANSIDALLVNSLRAGMRTLKNMPDQFANTVDEVMDGISKVFQGKSDQDIHPEGFRYGSSSDSQDDSVDSVGLRLFEEILGLRGLWLRRRLLAPVRTILADKINKKVLELVTLATSPRNIVDYLKYLKNWLTSFRNNDYVTRDTSAKARTRVAAKVALLAACTDDLRHIVGQEASRRGILTIFELFQKQDINRRLIYVLLEATLMNLFPENNIQGLFKKLYSASPRAQSSKRNIVA